MAGGKSAIALLLGPKPGGGADDGGGDDPSSGSMEDLEAAAQDFLDAVKRNDAKALAEAFRSMHDICGSYSEGK